MDPNRAEWNKHHQALRLALKNTADLTGAKQLFFDVHAPLHAYDVSSTQGWNLEEELWAGLTETEFRCIPQGEEHSIAWCMWHLARIEDITMNVLIADSAQVMSQADWARRLHSPIQDTGNLISPEGVQELSEQVAFADLRTYRSAVGQRTREIVSQLGVAEIKRKPAPERLQRLLAEGAVLPTATGLLDYWGNLTTAGLLLMPPTRHVMVHLNEMLTLKHKAKKELRVK